MKQATGAPFPVSSEPLARGAAPASPASPTPSPCAEEAAPGTQSLDRGFSNVVRQVPAGEEGSPVSGSPLCLSLCGLEHCKHRDSNSPQRCLVLSLV